MTKKPITRKTADIRDEADATGTIGGARFISDYVSGVQVRAIPEEVQAVQVFARRLIEDYGYTKSQIQTRPQYRVRARPSDEEKLYPVDIAVFNSSKKTED